MISINKQRKLGLVLISVGIVISLILVGVKNNFDEQGAFLCEAVSANPDIEMSACPVHTGNTTSLVMIGFVGSFFVFVLGAYIVLRDASNDSNKDDKNTDNDDKNTTRKDQGKKAVDTSTFDTGEKMIYDMLTNNQGSIYQSDIIKKTGFSKVKTTRILDKLEGKGIIERKRRGMTNIIILK